MSEKIKWKDFEGTPEDITRFFELSKLDLKKYLPSDKDIKTLNVILIVLGVLILVFFLILQFLSDKAFSVVSLLLFFVLLIELFFIHRRWDSISLTIVAAIIALMVFIVGVGISSPDSALKALIDLISKNSK